MVGAGGLVRGIARRALLPAVFVGVALAGATPAAAAPAAGYVAGSPWTAASTWTAARREAARPLPPVALAGAPASTVAAATGGSGVDTGDPTTFPNRANGVVYGEYVTAAGRERYQCSGSVIDSAAGNLVLTAGHCVIDPETGVRATALAFVPGYREGTMPYGIWGVSRYATTEAWAATAGGPYPDEGGDLAFLVLADDATGASVEDKVGALQMAFDQPRVQTYTEWGYPAEAPYDGEVLYSNTAAYEGSDPSFSPAPMRIASDFTGGSSGGPWTVSIGGVLTVLSLTDYTYEALPHSIYGAAARQTYEVATGEAAPVSSSQPPAATPAPPTTTSTAPAPTPAAVEPGSGSLRITSVLRDPAHGTATVVVAVGGPGTLRLSGAAVRTVSRTATSAGTYRLPVALTAHGTAARTLRRQGAAKVGVWVRLTSAAGVRQVSRLVTVTYGRDSSRSSSNDGGRRTARRHRSGRR
jgi:V8-like Glu-specific endopeptidase